MIKRFILLFSFINLSLFIYSNDQRVFQLVSTEKNVSYLSTEIGSFYGLTLVSDRMQLSLGYSFLGMEGFSLSTDLLLFEPKIFDFSLHTGVGGGIIFKPELEYLNSYFYLRMPLKLLYKDFYISGVPMFGSSMFEYNIIWDFNFTLAVGYQFDLYREKVEKKEDNK